MKYKKKEKVYQKLLKKVVKINKEYGEEMQPPCSVESLKRLREQARTKLQIDIPNEYATFLRRVNGLDWNGLVIYASERILIEGSSDMLIEGFVEANLGYWEFKPAKRFIFFGESGVDSCYVYDTVESKYQMLDRVALDLIETVPSFDHLIAEALKAHL